MSKSSRRKKKKRTKIGAFQVFLLILVLALIGSALIFSANIFGIASSVRNLLTASQFEIIDEHGIRQINGDYSVDEPGQKLENTHISGNLYLGSGIGEGSIELVNVAVDGSVLVQGGGLNTIYIRDCKIIELKLNRTGGEVRIVSSGDTTIDNTVIETGGRLVNNPAPGFEGFAVVEIMTADEVKLNGSFEVIIVNVPDANVEINSLSTGKLAVNRQAAGSVIVFPSMGLIENLYLDGSAFLIGEFEVVKAYLSAPGISELAGSFIQAEVTAEAGQYKLISGTTISKLTVEKEALNNTLIMENDTLITELELNEATVIKGEGLIEKLIVNSVGSILEQIPGAIIFGGDFVVTIAGHEITTQDMLKALIDHGDPLHVDLGARSQGAAIPIPKPAPEPRPVPDPAPELDPEPEPVSDLVSEFIVEEGLTPGKKLVIVALTVPDPQNYKVRVSGTALVYNLDANRFWGEVEASQAERNNVEVIR